MSAKKDRNLKPVKRHPGIYVREGKRGRRWVVQVSVPGQRAKVYGGTHGSLKAAVEALHQVRAEGAREQTRRMTVAEFAGEWLERYPRPKKSTNSVHKYAIRPFVARFGSYRMDKLPRDQVRDWGRLEATAGQGSTARAFLQDGIDAGYLTTNHLSSLGRSSPPGRANITVLTREEIDALAATALEVHGGDFGPVMSALILWSAYTGLRPGESLALRPEHILTDSDEIDVLGTRDKTGTITAPKNHRPRRVWLPPTAKAATRWLPDNGTGFVFVNKSAQPMRYGSLVGYWDSVRTAHAHATGEARYRTMDFYELRHSCASWMLNDLGLPAETVAHQLGHTGKTGSDLVLRLYGHPESSRYNKQAAAAARAQAQGGP
ncbi:MAG: tyrosine-type recombinase/integrase [Thermoleophilaceae bacterium]